VEGIKIVGVVGSRGKEGENTRKEGCCLDGMAAADVCVSVSAARMLFSADIAHPTMNTEAA